VKLNNHRVLHRAALFGNIIKVQQHALRIYREGLLPLLEDEEQANM